jgi:hypothetical protein
VNLDDALGLAKNYAERHTKSFLDFFTSGRIVLSDGETLYQHTISGAILFLVVGVTLQDSIISGIQIGEISWLDRALVQILFWVTSTLILYILLRLFGDAKGGAALVIFRVMPIAFLCGAYASALGAFARLALRMMNVDFLLPHLFHIVVQLSIIAVYMPRELRNHADQKRTASRAVTAAIFVFVLSVDLIVVFGQVFVRGSAG